MSIRVGDRVRVDDPFLAALREIMRSSGEEPKPNHHGTVTNVGRYEITITFDDGGATAAYPSHLVEKLVDRDKLLSVRASAKAIGTRNRKGRA